MAQADAVSAQAIKGRPEHGTKEGVSVFGTSSYTSKVHILTRNLQFLLGGESKKEDIRQQKLRRV